MTCRAFSSEVDTGSQKENATKQKLGAASSAAGFTLLELLLSVAILSLAASLAMPLIRRPPQQAQLSHDAARLAAALRVTRAAAMAQSSEMVFRIDAGERLYASPVVAMTRMEPTVGIDMTLPEEERWSASVGGVRFFPGGGASGGDIQLRLGQATARVWISPTTGRIHLGR